MDLGDDIAGICVDDIVVAVVAVVVVAVLLAFQGLSPIWFFKKTNKTHGAGAPCSTPATRDFHPLGFSKKPTKLTVLGAPRSAPAT